jgi:plastocyanin
MTDSLNRRELTLGTIAAALGGPALLSLVGNRAAAQGTAPAIEIVSPAQGATIDTNSILVSLNVSNFTLSAAGSGAPDQDGVGQALVFLDGDTVAQLTNLYVTNSVIVPGDGLTPGEHTLAVVLASNTHVPMMDTAQTVTIDYQPEQPLPLPVDNYTGAPSVTLVSPADGDTVPPQFDVQVQQENFFPTTGLEGKANVAGYGHYHVWVDTPEMSSSLAGLVLMPGTNAFTLDLSAWGPGEHQIRIETAQNDHTMYDPATAASFTVVVSGEAGATSASTPIGEATEAATVAAVAATEETSAPPASPAGEATQGVTVEMTDQLRFSPDHLSVNVGQTVTWVNSSAMPHTSTDDPAKNPVAAQHPEYAQLPDGAAPWNSGLLDPGDSFSYTFTVPGTYNYFCIPHVASGMVGTVEVTA